MIIKNQTIINNMKKINDMQRECDYFRISRNHCAASKDQFALSNRGKFIGQFQTYREALVEYEKLTKGE